MVKKFFSIFLSSLILVCQLAGVSVFADTAEPFAGDSEINIVYLGGTYVAEKAEGVESSWVEQMSAYFKSVYEKEGVTVNNYNAGITGDITLDGVMRITKDVLSKNPDLVIVNYSSDANYNPDLISAPYSQKCYESIFKTLSEARNVPYVLGLVLPNGDTNTVALTTYTKANYGVNSVNLVNSKNASSMDAGCWSNGSLTQQGHNAVADTIKLFFKQHGAALVLVKPDSTRPVACGGEAVTAVYKSANRATATGFTADANGSMTSAAAGDTLTFKFRGRWFSMQNAMGTGTYTVSIDGKTAVTVDTSKASSYGKCELSMNEADEHTAVITAQSAGVNIKGFYVRAVNSLNEAAAVYATGNSSTDIGTIPYNTNVEGALGVSYGSYKSGAQVETTTGFNDSTSYGMTAFGTLNRNAYSPVFKMKLQKGATYRIAFKVKMSETFYKQMIPTGENGEWHLDQRRLSYQLVNHDGKFIDINKNYVASTTGDIGMPSTNWCSYETTFTCGETTTSQSEDLCSLTVMLGDGLGTQLTAYTGNPDYTASRWYIDDVIIEQISGSVSETKPVVNSFSATGDQLAEGNVLSVTPAYSGDMPLMGYAYRVRRNMGGMWAELASGFTNSDSINYTVAAGDVGKTIKVDVVAYDTQGEFSAVKTHTFDIVPEFADIMIYNFENDDTLGISGAEITTAGSLGTKAMSVTTDSVTIAADIDPTVNYKVSAKIKASTQPSAKFAMSNRNAFTGVDMSVTALGDNWYSLNLDNYNFNAVNGTSYDPARTPVSLNIAFGESQNYVLDDIIIMPCGMTESGDVSVSLPESAEIFENISVTIGDESEDTVYCVFEISSDGTNWTTVKCVRTTERSVPYTLDLNAIDKKLRVTVYKDGTSYQYKTSNILEENTENMVASPITVTNSWGMEVKDVSAGFLTASAKIYNPSDTAEDVTLYSVVYTISPEKMVAVIPTTVSAGKGVTPVSYTMDMTNISHYSEYTHYLKSFLWDSEYTPLTDGVKTPAVTLIEGAVYNMYIDPSIETVEGIVMMNRHGESGNYASSTNFRAFCKERNLAIFDFYDGNTGVLKTFEDEAFAMNVLNTRIEEFAEELGHPELNYVPIATLGHSNGCKSAGAIAKLNPERTFAVICFKSATSDQFEYDALVEAGVPVFVVTGELDWDWGFHDQIHASERMVASGGAVTYIQHPQGGHGDMGAVEPVTLAFLDEAYKAKVKNATVSNGKIVMPETDIENGYIGYGEYTETVEQKWNNDAHAYVDETVYVYTNLQYMTYAEYKTMPADFKAQAWLFNESFAQKWANFINNYSN